MNKVYSTLFKKVYTILLSLEIGTVWQVQQNWNSLDSDSHIDCDSDILRLVNVTVFRFEYFISSCQKNLQEKKWNKNPD